MASRGAQGMAVGAARGEAGAGARWWYRDDAEDPLWVKTGAGRDEVVVAGARISVSTRGEVLSSAWEVEAWAMGEPILGALAVAPHLGGGYVHWSRSSVFRSAAFTGALARVQLGAQGATVRGVRNDLQGVLVFTESGPRWLPKETLEGKATLAATAYPEAGVFDGIALDGSRAVRMDVLGRARVTRDGGKAWADVATETGIFVRSLAATDAEVSLETWRGGMTFGVGGALGQLDASYRPHFFSGKQFVSEQAGARATALELLPWGWREFAPMASAVMGGATLGEGSVLALTHRSAARVDLRTGEVTFFSDGWMPEDLACVAQQVRGAVLLLCTREDGVSRGAVVLRTERGEPPVVEKVFGDEGYFVADDVGAVGYAGSCSEKTRLPDDDDLNRSWGEITPPPVMCVRRGPGAWVERALDVGERRALVAWVPRRDGGAVALVREQTRETWLPHATAVPRAADEGGVHVIEVGTVARDWYLHRPSRGGYTPRGAMPVLVERRFQALDDGSVAAWLSAGDSPMSDMAASRGVTFAADGSVTVHALPPGTEGMVVSGEYGLVVTAAGDLLETVDHGRSFRAAGRSPVPPSAMRGMCSRLGCVMDGVMRVGFGGHHDFSVTPDPAASCRDRGEAAMAVAPGACEALSAGVVAREPAPARPGLSCRPVGEPSPRAAEDVVGETPPKVQTVVTGWGEEMVVVRDREEPAAAPSPDPDSAPPDGPPGTPPGAPPAPSPPRKGPTLRTHSLVFRAPFDPRARLVRLDATDAGFMTGSTRYRSPVSAPLVGPRGEVGVLLLGESGEAIATPSALTSLPSYEPRRYSNERSATTTGLMLGAGRVSLLGEKNRRLYLEEHGPGVQQPLRGVGVDREPFRERTMVLALREDGARGVLVLDGKAPETAGVARLDAAEGPTAVERLAPWSTLTAGDDPRCKAGREPGGAWWALVVIEPARALGFDTAALPGVEFSAKGLALLRWGRARVCMEALDVAVSDGRRGQGSASSARLVARWTGGAGGGAQLGSARVEASLVSADLRQGLACTVTPVGAPEERPRRGEAGKP
ncbi:hypothetical protein [Chondromyces apiculatus]|uniref:hypothetical protein n=1 Tax=Chondromyces apiculatus TaxID=51 RepID=UPI0012DD6EF3|nr:hypothetical protein [Chondromyces apiculatus]